MYRAEYQVKTITNHMKYHKGVITQKNHQNNPPNISRQHIYMYTRLQMCYSDIKNDTGTMNKTLINSLDYVTVYILTPESQVT